MMKLSKGQKTLIRTCTIYTITYSLAFPLGGYFAGRGYSWTDSLIALAAGLVISAFILGASIIINRDVTKEVSKKQDAK